jgi:hypothetical protein
MTASHALGPGILIAVPTTAHTVAITSPSSTPTPCPTASTPSSGNTVLVAAVVSAVVTLAVGFLTQVIIGRRERQARTYERVRSSLQQLLESCLTLRVQTREYGRIFRREAGTAHPDLAAAVQQFDLALERVQVDRSYVDDIAAQAVTRWIEAAQFRFISTEDVTEQTEEALWDELTTIIGAALKDPDAKVSRIEEIRPAIPPAPTQGATGMETGTGSTQDS